jgi:hypothetical protein
LNNDCKNCSTGCVSCNGATSCNYCNSNHYILNSNKGCNDVCLMNDTVWNSDLKRCSCPSSNYFDTSSNLCKNCSTGCLSCFSDTQCNQCDSAFSIDNGVCSSKCTSAQYFNYSSLSCMSCSIGCSICKNSSYCSACSTNQYKLYDNACVDKCASQDAVYDSVTNNCVYKNVTPSFTIIKNASLVSRC